MRKAIFNIALLLLIIAVGMAPVTGAMVASWHGYETLCAILVGVTLIELAASWIIAGYVILTPLTRPTRTTIITEYR